MKISRYFQADGHFSLRYGENAAFCFKIYLKYSKTLSGTLVFFNI